MRSFEDVTQKRKVELKDLGSIPLLVCIKQYEQKLFMFIYMLIYISVLWQLRDVPRSLQTQPEAEGKVMKAGSCKTHSSPREGHLHKTLQPIYLFSK